jgi:hypothetical protein
VDENVAISRRKDEAGAELERILPEPVLPVAGGPRADPRRGVVAAKEVEQVRRVQSRGFVRRPPGIDQQWERDAGLVAKQSGIVHVPEPDRGQSGAGLFELVVVLAQLRDMLAAEDSAVVSQKDNHGGTFLPQRAETDFTAAGLR